MKKVSHFSEALPEEETQMNNPTTDRIGVSKLETLFAESGWFFREQFVKDYGIDAQVEVVENDDPTGQLIAIQIKSGESLFL